MNKLDFLLDKVETPDGHVDYWFKVKGGSLKELEEEFWEQSMVQVTSVVYSKDEDVVGVRRDFPFNWDVVLTENKKLKKVLKELTP
jgi:hypothetical protein